ncbi:MAG: hypothetical protein B6I25_07245 [Planctomycetales bacterium 4572_13]|nr:MAG: hypothetical protein B6I25_07245 [Planctomycetales bacterium 4572_13]
MLSEKQLLANQQNALCSTGPRTIAGKAISSQNAIRHGLRAENTIIPGEDPEEFDQFRQLLLDDLLPAGAMEVFLVDRIVASLWKLHRAGRIESELFNEMDSAPQDSGSGKQNSGIPFNVAFTKTYACPVHGQSLDQQAPPTDCQSCPLTPQTETSEPKTDVLPVTESNLDTPVQDPELDDFSSGDKDPEPETPKIPALGRIFKYDMAGGNIMARFRLYEGQIERSLYKAMTELQKLQILRSNQWMPAPDPSRDQIQAPESVKSDH